MSSLLVHELGQVRFEFGHVKVDDQPALGQQLTHK